MYRSNKVTTISKSFKELNSIIYHWTYFICSPFYSNALHENHKLKFFPKYFHEFQISQTLVQLKYVTALGCGWSLVSSNFSEKWSTICNWFMLLNLSTRSKKSQYNLSSKVASLRWLLDVHHKMCLLLLSSSNILNFEWVNVSQK